VKDYLNHLPPLELNFDNCPLIKEEWKRMEETNSYQLLPFDLSKYTVSKPKENKLKDVNDWQKSISNAKTQLEHQYLRLENIELMKNYGANKWILYVQQLEENKKRLEQILSKYKENIRKVNRVRKTEQTKAGKKLEIFENQYKETLRSNLELYKTCAYLEQDIERLEEINKTQPSLIEKLQDLSITQNNQMELEDQ